MMTLLALSLPDDRWHQVGDLNRVIDLWSQVTEIRNRLDHAGMAKGEKPARSMRKEAGKIVDRLQTLGEAKAPS